VGNIGDATGRVKNRLLGYEREMIKQVRDEGENMKDPGIAVPSRAVCRRRIMRKKQP
jgi:hypothetical protein